MLNDQKLNMRDDQIVSITVCKIQIVFPPLVLIYSQTSMAEGSIIVAGQSKRMQFVR